VIEELNVDTPPQYQRCLTCKEVFFICGKCLGAKCPSCKGTLINKEVTFPDNLFNAIKNNNLEKVEKICNVENTDLNHIFNDNSRDTPLISAAISRKYEICQWLINTGNASIKAKNKNGRTALIEMVRCRNSNWPRKLAKLFAASVNEQDKSGKTALMFASVGAGLFGSNKGNLKVIKQLLEFGADIFIADNFENTALSYAKLSNKRGRVASNYAVVEYLEHVEIEANRSIKNKLEKMPLETFMIEKNISELKFKCTNDNFPTVEVDLDSLPENYHGYQQVVDSVLQNFIMIHSESEMTIYVYQTQSINFIDHMCSSAFFGVVGKKKSQEKLLDMLLAAFKNIEGVNTRFSDYINTTISLPEFHVEDEYIWHPIDATTWGSKNTCQSEEPITDFDEVMDDDQDEEDFDEFVDDTEGENVRTAVPTRYRIARADVKIGTIKRKIEEVFGLPEGSVALCDQEGKALRADARIRTLRKRWE